MIVVRLLLTPVAVLAVSLLQRRLGPALSGRVLGLPLTTGPFLVVLGLRSGPSAVASAALGAVMGELSTVALCACYGLTAQRDRPGSAVTRALGAGLLAALGGAVLATALRDVQAWWVALLVIVAGWGVATTLRSEGTSAIPVPPLKAARRTQIVLRMGITEVVVMALLGLSTALGAGLAGLLSALPVILSVMLPAAHRGGGAAAAVAVARNTLTTLPATTAALLVVGVTLVPLGPWVCAGLTLTAFTAANGVVIGAVAAADRFAAEVARQVQG